MAFECRREGVGGSGMGPGSAGPLLREGGIGAVTVFCGDFKADPCREPGPGRLGSRVQAVYGHTSGVGCRNSGIFVSRQVTAIFLMRYPRVEWRATGKRAGPQS